MNETDVDSLLQFLAGLVNTYMLFFISFSFFSFGKALYFKPRSAVIYVLL